MTRRFGSSLGLSVLLVSALSLGACGYPRGYHPYEPYANEQADKEAAKQKAFEEGTVDISPKEDGNYTLEYKPLTEEQMRALKREEEAFEALKEADRKLKAMEEAKAQAKAAPAPQDIVVEPKPDVPDSSKEPVKLFRNGMK